MKEKQHEQHVGNILCCFRQTIRIMRVSVFFMVVSTAIAWSATTYSQSTKLSVNLKDATVQEVIKTIEEQSEFLFLYQEGQVDLNRHISIRAEGKQLQEILDEVFKGTGNIYIVSDRQIVIGKAPRKALEAQLAAIQKDLKTTIEQPQQREIKGKVTDYSGEPLPGATVMIKGTTIGSITDANGNFTLRIPANAQTIQISFVGMKTQEIPINGATIFNIALAEEAIGLQEVVAVGYGTARKGDLTGAISSIKGETLTNRSTQQISTAMQGQIAGVQVTRNSGAPGASATVRIRGITTLSNNDPLVIVDGVPSSLNDVIAADVETMTVLKDAASAAIYGSRAAAGVILITTKRAKDREFTFDYNYEYGIDRPTARPKNGDVIDWMNVQNEVKWNDGASDPYSQYSQETIASWLTKNATDPWHYPNTNWVDLILKKSTSHEQHMFSVSGGTEKLHTKSTFNYQKGDGYYENKSYERFVGRINNDYYMTDWLRANIDVDFSKSNSINPSEINAMYWAYLASPYYTPFWEDGRYADAKDGANPVAGLREGGKNRTNYYKFGGKAQIDLIPMKGLTLSAIFAPRFSFTKGKRFSRAVPVYYENGSITYMQSHKTTNLSETRNDNNSQTYQFYGNYQNK